MRLGALYEDDARRAAARRRVPRAAPSRSTPRSRPRRSPRSSGSTASSRHGRSSPTCSPRRGGGGPGRRSRPDPLPPRPALRGAARRARPRRRGVRGGGQADPRHLPSLRALEALYESAGRREDLFRNLAAQRVAPGDAAAKERVLAKMAALADELGRADEAVALWKELLAARPRHEGALAALEELYERLERWSDLAQHLRLRLSATVDRREIARLNDKLGAILGTRLGDSARRSSRTRRSSTPIPRTAAPSRRCATSTRRRARPRPLAGVYRRLVPLQEDAPGVKRIRLELAEVAAPRRQQARGDRAGEARLRHRAARRRGARPHRGGLPRGRRRRGRRPRRRGARRAPRRGGRSRRGDPGVARRRGALEGPEAPGRRRRRAREGARARPREPHRLRGRSGRSTPPPATGARSRGSATSSRRTSPTPPRRSRSSSEVAGVHEKKLGQKEMAFLSCVPRARRGARRRGACSPRSSGSPPRPRPSTSSARCSSRSPTRRAGRCARGSSSGSASVRDERLDDADGAEAAFRRALEADPASPEALEALTQLFKRRGRVRDLVITLEQKLEAAAGLDEKKATLLEVGEDLRRRAPRRRGGGGRAPARPRARRRRPRTRSRRSPPSSGASRAGRTSPRCCPAPATSPPPTRRASPTSSRLPRSTRTEIDDDEAAVEAYRTVLGLDDRNEAALARARAALHEARSLRRAEPRLRAADRARRGSAREGPDPREERRDPRGEAPRPARRDREERGDPPGSTAGTSRR